VAEKTMMNYDVIIIGSGPAGLASAYQITKLELAINVLVLESGRFHHRRPCPVDMGQECKGCGGICNVISGFGGCVHYGDGVKLSLMPSGQRLIELFGEEKAYNLAYSAFDVLSSYTNDELVLRGQNISNDVHECFAEFGLIIREYPVAVVAETQIKQILNGLYEDLKGKVNFEFESEVVNVEKESSSYIVTVENKSSYSKFKGRNIVFATGRHGLVSTQNIFEKLKVSMSPPKASIGVRFEMRSSYLQTIGMIHPDLKISKRDLLEEKAKTFCFCGGLNGGRIKFTNYQNSFGKTIITLDGHETCERVPHENLDLAANFGILCQISDSEKDINNWIYERVILPYQEISNGHPIVQTLRSFRDKENDSLSWNDLKSNLPFEPSINDLVVAPLYQIFSDKEHQKIVRSFDEIMAPILKISNIDKKVIDIIDEVIVVGLEIEFLWNKININSYGETSQKGIWVAGDTAGVAQGIIQAMMMGLRVAEGIIAS
jgi:uncharacterized FAD-dependent dehydrogenase